MEILLIAIGAIVALDLLAYRYGAESREGFGRAELSQPEHKHVTPTDAVDAELARQLLESRCARTGSISGRTPSTPSSLPSLS